MFLAIAGKIVTEEDVVDLESNPTPTPPDETDKEEESEKEEPQASVEKENSSQVANLNHSSPPVPELENES